MCADPNCRPTSTEAARVSTRNDPLPMSARDCAQHIVDAFARYNAEFRAITRRAPLRFDARDSRGGQHDAVERIELYDRFVKQTIDELKEALGECARERDLWKEIHNEFASRISDLPDPEFTKTFFSSISRRLFGTVGVAPDIEFVATDLDPLANTRSTVGTNNYVNHGSLSLLFEDLLGDVRFRSAWRDLDKSIAYVFQLPRRSSGKRTLALGQICHCCCAKSKRTSAENICEDGRTKLSSLGFSKSNADLWSGSDGDPFVPVHFQRRN